MVETERVLASVRKAGDLETRIRVVEVEGEKVIELRDWVPSLGEYGRGYWVPADRKTLGALAQALFQAAGEVE